MVSLPALPINIRLVWIHGSGKLYLAYYDTAKNIAVKSFIVPSLEHSSLFVAEDEKVL